MQQVKESFDAVPGYPGIHVGLAGKNRCVAVPLSKGAVCLYNPTKKLHPWLSPALQALGSIQYLLSPNHYHHAALAEYQEQLPKAVVCVSKQASPRIQQVTGLKTSRLSGLKRKLPADVQLLEPKGLKTGEIWLRLESDAGVCWLVGDAICGPQNKTAKAFATEPEILKPFPKFGLGDRAEFLDWFGDRLEQDAPTTVIPCHGGLLRSKRMPSKLWKLMSTSL